MIRKLLVTMLAGLCMAPALTGQVNIAVSPFLYRSADNYNDCDGNDVCHLDGLILDPNHRNVPIRLRYPRNTTGPLPLVLWSHGGGLQENGRALNSTWGRTLARAGYIVIHMSHRPITAAEHLAMCAEFGAADQTECAGMPQLNVYQPRDANSVLAALDAIEQNVPDLNGRIDRQHISVAGWSGGSLTAMALAGARFRLTAASPDVSFANPLPKVFMTLSPQGPGYLGLKSDSWRLITRPVLVATGAGDTTQGEDAPSRLVAFQMMPGGKKYQLYINHPGSTHDTFNLENDLYPISAQWLASYALAYFDYHLKDRPLAGAYLISQRLPLQGSRKIVQLSRK